MNLPQDQEPRGLCLTSFPSRETTPPRTLRLYMLQKKPSSALILTGEGPDDWVMPLPITRRRLQARRQEPDQVTSTGESLTQLKMPHAALVPQEEH